jgi:hypothetical protein
MAQHDDGQPATLAVDCLAIADRRADVCQTAGSQPALHMLQPGWQHRAVTALCSGVSLLLLSQTITA